NGGHLHRDWTYIDDVVDGFISALDKGFAWEIFNLGYGRPVENIEFVQILESLLGKKAHILDTPVPLSEPLITFADTTKAQRMLGYEPKTDVEHGLNNFIQWLRAEKLLD
ncbi:MAG TPA: hypothetical protein VF719_13395, partial [Abditibacteriaceae bacterium]